MEQQLQRLQAIKGRMVAAAKNAGRNPEDVTLVTVSKNFDAADIIPLLQKGHRVFGENRVQEAIAKWPSMTAKFPGVELHLIGPLQSNKTAEAVGFFDAIQTVDREKIALAISIEAKKQNRDIQIYVQVNTGDEPQKAGVKLESASLLIAKCQELFGTKLRGLMCIPPIGEDPRPHFDKLRELANQNGLTGLSMGMSSDYEIAIEAGATLIRVGSAIFGARLTKP